VVFPVLMVPQGFLVLPVPQGFLVLPVPLVTPDLV
jgi:hypothetical protein